MPSWQRRLVHQAVALIAAGTIPPPILQAPEANAGKPSCATAAECLADWLFSGGGLCADIPAQPLRGSGGGAGKLDRLRGQRHEAVRWRGTKTRVVDLRETMLLSGFVDAHDHLASLGATELGVNMRERQGQDAVQEQPAGAVLQGHGWKLELMGGISHRREWLDAVTGDRPMDLLSFDMHDM